MVTTTVSSGELLAAAAAAEGEATVDTFFLATGFLDLGGTFLAFAFLAAAAAGLLAAAGLPPAAVRVEDRVVRPMFASIVWML